jgi:hypothetical protein
MTDKLIWSGTGLQVSTAFDGGGLARVSELEPDVLDCWPYEEGEYRDGFISLPSLRGADAPRDGANYSFLFRLDGCRNRKITLRFHVVRERGQATDVSVVYANPDFPVISYDGEYWERTPQKRLRGGDGLADTKIVEVEHTFRADSVWVAYQYPYTNDHLSRFLTRIEGAPYCRVEAAGFSTEGRAIPMISITDPAVPLPRKRVAWFTGLQHCAELAAGWGLQSLAELLLSAAPLAVEARQKFEFKLIPMVNVDAVAEGRGRIHRSGRNLNREWERPDPVGEVGTIRQTLDAWRARGNSIDTMVDFHGFSTRDGAWTALVLPPDFFSGEQARCYARLLECIKVRLPGIRYEPFPSLGLATGAGARTYGALALSIDGWIYRGPGPGPADLDSYHAAGCQVMDLAQIRAAAAQIVRAWVDFAG